jgi:ABC-type multidrug transport system fused ATPase/permease subunit
MLTVKVDESGIVRKVKKLSLAKLLMPNWPNSLIFKALSLLPKSDRRKLMFISIVQISLGALDLLGVAAIGLLGSLTITGLGTGVPGSRTNQALELLNLSSLSFQMQALFLGISATVLLVGRTILSIIFTRRILFFFSRRAAVISSNLMSRLLSQSILIVQSRTTQQNLYAVTTGVLIIMMQVLATSTVLIADLSLLVVMTFGLFIVDPGTAAGTLLLFCSIGFFLYRFMQVRAGMLGKSASEMNIRSNEKILEVFASFRESVVRNRRDYYAREIGKLRTGLADTLAELNFLPYVSKYVIETAVLVGALVLSSTQFFLQDAKHAIATLAIFLAAGTRIAPAVLRIQQGSITIRSGMGQASPTLELVELLGSSPLSENRNDNIDIDHEGFIPNIELRNISFTYPNKENSAISDFSLEVKAGSSVAFVGPSGAGKSTIVDILLGVLIPDSGSVTISGMTPVGAVSKWPGAVAYVPQDVVTADGTFRENVALGFPSESASNELITRALTLAQLNEFIEELPEGMDTQVGERGAKISGGQRQRLGIARAMLTHPRLLVLDEATSSLDAETEESISNAITSLHGSTTVVMIAHRLSTVRNADVVVYLSEGRLIAKGSFREVRDAVSEFDNQANLMGL